MRPGRESPLESWRDSAKLPGFAMTESRQKNSINVQDGAAGVQAWVDWAARHPYWVIGFLLLTVLGPLGGKAVHIDDPLFVWTAEHLRQDPLHFYSFTVNWYGAVMAMPVVTCNPPVTSYLLAGGLWLLGPGEWGMHLILGLTALAAAAGMYELARMWCGRPLLATLLALAMPVSVVSATTLMCDVPMVAAWLWSLVLWERGLKSGRAAHLLPAVGLAGLAVLTKYSALTLLPLLPLLGLLRRRKLGAWVLWLVVPVGMIAGYEWVTGRMYGQGLIAAAAGYAAQHRFALEGGRLNKTVIGLIYLGGGLLPVGLLAPWLWRRAHGVMGGWVIGGISALTIYALQAGGLPGLPATGEYRWLILVEMGLMLAGGCHILWFTVVALRRERDAVTFTAAAWIASGFLFAAVLNWTVSARSLLPLVAPVAILVVRRLEGFKGQAGQLPRWAIPLGLAGLFSLTLAWADAGLADAGRAAAGRIAADYPPAQQRVWFEGHCAFQYYLERQGGRAVDYDTSTLQPGEVLVVPDNNSNLLNPPADAVSLLATPEFAVCPWLGTVRAELGAGFYGAGGCLPFVAAPVPAEKYYVYRVTRPFQFSQPPETSAENGVQADDPLTVASDEAILRAHPDDAATHASLADILSRQGQSAAAREHYEAALRLEPDQVVCLNNLAWLLATSGDARLRNGAEAVQHAERACALTQYQKTVFLGTLGAAYAEAGRFAEAIATAQKACANATARGETALLARNQVLLALYQSHQAYHEPPEKLVPAAP